MELERMREILATKAMGWTRIDRSEDGFIYYQEDGRTQYYTSVPLQQDRGMWEWQPDANWAQCGLVIEAMRAKDWDWHMSMYASGVISVGLRHEETGKRVSVDINENYGDERYARMLAACRALGPEAADGA